MMDASLDSITFEPFRGPRADRRRNVLAHIDAEHDDATIFHRVIETLMAGLTGGAPNEPVVIRSVSRQ